jgi:TRAP-type C4-dicarboxylate transport system substrate-binding protein
MLKKLVFFMFVVSLLFSTYSFTRAEEPIKIKVANYFPPTHMCAVLLGNFCNEVNKKLPGKVELTQYVGGTLLTAPKMATGVASGIADMGFSHCAYSRGRFPVMEIVELPLGFPSSYVATHVANEFYDKFKPKEWKDYKVLFFTTSPVNVVQTLNKPVKTLEDFKGLKLRATGRIADITKALGGVPMPVEIVDLYEALKRGVAEGAYLTMETFKGFKTGELLKYCTESWKLGSVFAFYLVMNKEKWDTLSPDVQKVLVDVSKKYVEEYAVGFNKIDIEGRDFFLKQGGKMVTISNEESAKWVNAVQPVIADYKKDLIAKGYTENEVDTWLKFVNERINYWKGQEKLKKIPTPFKY